MTSITTDQLNLLQARAEELIRKGKAQAAIDELDRANEDLSTFPDLFRLKGISKLLQGNNTEARLIFDQIEGCFGDSPEFLNIYGVALRRERDFLKSREMYERGLELKPDDPSLLNNYGNLLIDLQKYKRARECIQKALSINPDYSDAKQNLARLQRCIDQSQKSSFAALESISSTTRADLPNHDLSIDEEAAADWLKLAATAQRNKNLDESLMFIRKSLEAQPDLSAAYKLAGEVLISQEKYREAERMLLYGVLFGEDDTDTLANLGSLAAIRGNASISKILLNRVINLNSEHQAALANLKILATKMKDPSYVQKSIF